ncbi:MAG: KGG domain-containing protein [Myxococcales bacterium]
MADEKKGGMTVAEAGRKGGVKVAQERGRAFYEQIGKKGGESVRASRGPEFYSQIGHKGGQKVRELIEQGKRLGKANQARAPEIVESSEEDRAPAGSSGMNAGRGEE